MDLEEKKDDSKTGSVNSDVHLRASPPKVLINQNRKKIVFQDRKPYDQTIELTDFKTNLKDRVKSELANSDQVQSISMIEADLDG